MLNIGLNETTKCHRVGSYTWGPSLVSGPSRGTSLAMETKPVRDETKPEGYTSDQEIHVMVGMHLTSWQGHHRTSFAKAPGTWRAYESRTRKMKAASSASLSSA